MLRDSFCVASSKTLLDILLIRWVIIVSASLLTLRGKCCGFFRRLQSYKDVFSCPMSPDDWRIVRVIFLVAWPAHVACTCNANRISCAAGVWLTVIYLPYQVDSTCSERLVIGTSCRIISRETRSSVHIRNTRPAHATPTCSRIPTNLHLRDVIF